jgi:hypothetical protein
MNDQTMMLILVMAFFMLGCRFSCSGMREDFINLYGTKTGHKCDKDSDCFSDWCFSNKCKAKYGYLEPKWGLCASNKECTDGHICYWGKCK